MCQPDMDSTATPSILTHRDYTVGWICALPTEMAAPQAMLDQRHNPLGQDRCDDNTYALGRIGVDNVVLACLPSGVTGVTSAARVAGKMLFTFRWLRFGLMMGIGGAFGGVIQNDFGKTVQASRIKYTGSLKKPPDVLQTAIATLEAKNLTEDPDLSKHLAKTVRQYPKMRSQFGHLGKQHDKLYNRSRPSRKWLHL